MQLEEVQFADAPPIDGYGPGFFRVGGALHEGAILVMPGSVRRWGGFDDSATLVAVAAQIDVVFVGTGAEICHIPPGLRDPVEAAGPGIEIMASPAACRSYNVLLSEGRRIAAALLPVG